MSSIYQSPLRVYLALGALALCGIWAGLNLPVSLFPNSSKPTIAVTMSYGDMSAQEFLNTYGLKFEGDLQNINIDTTQVDKLMATYSTGFVRYKVEFKWGADPRKALREVQNTAAALTAQLSQEIRSSSDVEMWSDNSGFLALSFFSQKLSLDELYRFLGPQILPAAKKVKDAEVVDLWNPASKEVRIELNPEKMALLQLFPRDVANALLPQLTAYRGGTFTEGLNQLTIEMPPAARTVEDIKRAVISSRTGQSVHLSDIAAVEFGVPSNNVRSIKTSGAPSLILFANPKAGGNIKRMAEEILAVIKTSSKRWPADIQYKTIVDPSEFIESAVTNVVHEVIMAAFLAVVVLFLFIGNIRNVVTAAIEIPLSIVLAFVMMRLFNINLNLISLGGLALSAGMNVDGSVVVMENIFRHFDMAKGPLDAKRRLQILVEAVNEVRFPILASTVASLVVFIPLAFTSALTNAILGDLAMAVVFSHGFSAVVALILVPTVRLQLMARSTDTHSHSFLEPVLKKIESTYARALDYFLKRHSLKRATYLALTMLLAALCVFVLPRLPREVVGKPDTDWLILSVNTRGNTLTRQMESLSDVVEARMLEKFGDKIRYTFTQTRGPNQSSIMARLTDKREMQSLWKGFEAEFGNTPEVQYMVMPWNPSELAIPNPPDMKISVTGNQTDDRVAVGRALYEKIMDAEAFPRVQSQPDLTKVDSIRIMPTPEQWSGLASKYQMSPADLADVSRTATIGRRLWQIPIAGDMVPVELSYPGERIKTYEDLEALPIGVGGKLVPLKSLANLRRQPAIPDYYRENQNDMILITGSVNKGDEKDVPANLAKVTKIVEDWQKTESAKHTSAVVMEDAAIELTEALHELTTALGLSVLLIFLTMFFQFGDVVNSVLVLVAIPLGFIGVLISLFVCQSTLSLNSVLGVILLNGIAVANSIILVDFLKRLVDQGLDPHHAALEAASKRLRPILMTSLTTGLGMFPIALGLGEGGRILQPLGIAVVGGLAFSMATTLFLVPALQVSYLQWKERRHPRPAAATIKDKKIDWVEPPQL